MQFGTSGRKMMIAKLFRAEENLKASVEGAWKAAVI